MVQATQVGTCDVDGMPLSDGRTVRVRLAYTSQGPAGAPTYLLLHGYTGSHFALAPHPAAADSAWACAWVGPGKALDTRRCRVLTVNLPGSSYGSGWEGADHAYASIAGMAWAIDTWLGGVGVERLHGAIGYSFGGYVALGLKSWHPSRVARTLVICSASRGRGSLDELDALRRLDTPEKRFAHRMETLRTAGLAQWTQDHGEQVLARECSAVRLWAAEFSAASLWRLRAAAATFELPRWPADTTALYASSDLLFPPRADGAGQVHTIQTRYGHQALLLEPDAWLEPIGRWARAEPPGPASISTPETTPKDLA